MPLLMKMRMGRGPSENLSHRLNEGHLVSRNVFDLRDKPGSICLMTVEGIVCCSTDRLDERKGTLVR